MKRIIYIISLLVFFGCDYEDSIDCIQAAGDLVEQEYTVSRFKKIIVWEGVQLIIRQGDSVSIVVQTGENLLNEIIVRVEDNTLHVSNNTNCNFVRDYGITKVFVTSPNIEEIRNSSGLTVESRGDISFPFLTLISEDPDSLGEYHKDGDFIINNLDVRVLWIKANGLSNFYLTGKAFNCHFGASDSDVRIEAANLEIQNLYLFHRSTNKMIVNPQVAIRGKIKGLGDVISKNHPPIVEVEEYYKGKLIFED